MCHKLLIRIVFLTPCIQKEFVLRQLTLLRESVPAGVGVKHISGAFAKRAKRSRNDCTRCPQPLRGTRRRDPAGQAKPAEKHWAGDASSVGEDVFVVGHAYLMHDRQVPMPS